ncbi:MAG: UDP-N-acetylmuramate:L-alanyl-gamma-D-glutamyl-meso-diaminopimelate ligase [Desulfobacterales bacterium]
MDPQRNRIPDTINHVHLIAACGSGMAALASLLKDQGYRVSGSDRQVYPPMSTFLAERGIDIEEGFDGHHLDLRPDLVVVGNAVIRDNPEARRTAELELNYCSMPQAVNHFLARGKEICLALGTHGKTTTASLLAWILAAAGRDPSFFIGGILGNFDCNYRQGQGGAVVIEGDEYDTAFFDKGPKFLHYPSRIAMLTGIEFDHADIYRDLAHVKSAFARFMAAMPAQSTLLVYDGCPTARELSRSAAAQVVFYGDQPESPWRLGEIAIDPPWTHFKVWREDQPWGAFRTQLSGRYNLYNILAALAAAQEMGISPEAAVQALSAFRSTRRRQEVRGVAQGITVMDDFAHHPTAVAATIGGVAPLYPQGRVIAVFEPRTNTSMRAIFQSVYPQALSGADLVLIREPSRLDKIPVAERLRAADLVADIRELGTPAHFFADSEGILDFLVDEARPGDLVLVMSNGGFDNIHQRLLDRLARLAPR